MRKFALNPFFYYFLGFTIAIVLLSLGVSGIYPEVDLELLTFILFTTIATLFFVFFLSDVSLKKLNNSFSRIIKTHRRNSIFIFGLLLILFLIDCLSVMTIPLVEVVLGRSYRYSSFGVPILHAFVITYSSIVCFSYFLKYQNFKEKHYLYTFIFALSISLLMVNRAVFIYNIIGITAIYLAFKANTKVVKNVLLFLVGTVFVFSLLGNLRTISDTKDNLVNTHTSSLRDVARIEKTWFPDVLVWPYMYLVSPYGNLQEDFKRSQNYNYGIEQVPKVISQSILPDFISKRLTNDFEKSIYENYLIEDTFNVSTGYAGMVKIYGLYGMIIFFIYYIFFMAFFIIFSPSKNFAILMAGLCSTSFLLIFTNGLYNLTQFSFPFLVVILSRIRFGNYYFL